MQTSEKDFFTRERNAINHFSKNEFNKLMVLLVREYSSLTNQEISYIKETYTQTDRNHLECLIKNMQILPFAAHIFYEIGCDEEYWKEKHNKYIKRNTEIKEIVDKVFQNLNKYGCDSVTLTENFAVVLTTNGCIGDFCSGDVDLSADIKEQEKITSCLNSMNFFSKDQPNSIGEYVGQSMQFFNESIFEEGFWINVIWKPVTRAFLVQEKYEKRLSKDRLDALTIPNTSIRVLQDDSLMYFCSLHIAAGHYYTLPPGLRLFIDIDRLARAKKIDWNRLIQWEEEDNAGIRISTILYLSALILKTPIPNDIYKKCIKNRRNRMLLKYLYNSETKMIQNKSSKLRRLYIELASDDANLFFNFVKRFFVLVLSKLKLN